MIDVFVERRYHTPLSHEGLQQLASASENCLSLYRIDWRQSFLAASGLDLICHFQAPDLESVRQALRQSDSHYHSAWSGTVHPAGIADNPNVLVARRFDAPTTIAELQAREEARDDCLKTHNVRFVTSFFSRDRQRMLCLYAAPDAEAVRHAQHQADMPMETVWSFRHYHPDR